MALNRSQPTVDASRFAMVPRADIQRATFIRNSSHKTTFDAGFLVPIYIDEIIPGDVHKGTCSIFARMATPVFPVMDNITLETHFFFCPNRLVWENWKKMMGERANPTSSISFTTPQVEAEEEDGFTDSLYDYLGLPMTGQDYQTGFGNPSVNAMPLRMYNLIYNEWYRDQNLQNSLPVPLGDGPDEEAWYTIQRRNKRHDYFTSALPWPLKGGVEVNMPITGMAPVLGIAVDPAADPTDGNPTGYKQVDGTTATGWLGYLSANHAGGNPWLIRTNQTTTGAEPEIYADLSTTTGQTINALRLAVQTQRLLERDARSGTRYTELLRAHFGVTPEDTRLQRPEYIGGGRTNFTTQAIPQTSASAIAPTGTPIGHLGAAATATDQHRFNYSATEHGFIIGLVHVTGEITYQQGLHRMWSRQTRYDYPWPVFANLGEQAILTKELYVIGDPANDDEVFGYQERYAEYRHMPSRITGKFRSAATGTMDQWHLSQQFITTPVLNSDFIQDRPPFERILAAGAEALGQQILFDSFFKVASTRPLPMYSVPGQLDRF